MKIFEDFLNEAKKSYPEYKKGTILYSEEVDDDKDEYYVHFYQIVKRDEDLCHIRRLKSKVVSKPNSQGAVLIEPMKGKFQDAKPFVGILPYLVVQQKYGGSLPLRMWDGGRIDSHIED